MRSLKKAICVCLIVLLALYASGCGGARYAKGTNKSLYEQGLDIVELLVEMVNNETYLHVFTADTELLNTLSAVSKGDFSSVQQVYAITAGADFYDGLNELGIMDEMSESLLKSVKSRAMASQMAQVNAYGGANCLAAASICTASKSFVNDSIQEDTVYVYTFENAVPVAVAFTVGDDGAVSASGNFILYDGAENFTAQELKELFGLAVNIEKV